MVGQLVLVQSIGVRFPVSEQLNFIHKIFIWQKEELELVR